MKRSKGVTIFSWLILVRSIFAIIGIQNPRPLNPPFVFFFSIVILPLSIVAAINLLRLKNWARTGVIIIAILVVAKHAVTIPYVMSKSREYLSEKYEVEVKPQIEELLRGQQETEEGEEAGEGAEQPSDEDIERSIQAAIIIGQLILAVLILVSAVFNIGVIYFFTRPIVKEQFKEIV